MDKRTTQAVHKSCCCVNIVLFSEDCSYFTSGCLLSLLSRFWHLHCNFLLLFLICLYKLTKLCFYTSTTQWRCRRNRLFNSLLIININLPITSLCIRCIRRNLINLIVRLIHNSNLILSRCKFWNWRKKSGLWHLFLTVTFLHSLTSSPTNKWHAASYALVLFHFLFWKWSLRRSLISRPLFCHFKLLLLLCTGKIFTFLWRLASRFSTLWFLNVDAWWRLLLSVLLWRTAVRSIWILLMHITSSLMKINHLAILTYFFIHFRNHCTHFISISALSLQSTIFN